MKQRTGGIAALFLIVFFGVLFYCGANAYMQGDNSSDNKASAARVVHVGIQQQRGYSILQEYGGAVGFDAEYMYKIAQYAGFQIEFHPYKDFRALLSALEQGEVQVALGISQTDERREKFLFTDNWMNRGMMSIRVRVDDKRYDYGNVQKIDGMRIGAIRGSVMLTKAERWAENNEISPQFVLYENVGDLEEALIHEDVDGVVVSGMMLSDHYRAILRVSTDLYYPVLNKNEKKLRLEIDNAMNRILREEPLYPEKLKLKYLSDDQNRVFFTAEEESYLQEHPVLRVAIADLYPPFYEEKNGVSKGIVPDFYRIVAMRIGVKVEFIKYKNRYAALDAMHRGEADVLGISTEDIIAASQVGLVQTKPYFSLEVFQILRPRTADINRAAVMNFMPEHIRNAINARFPNIHFIEYPDIKSCFDALESGEVDSLFCNVVQMNSFMSRFRPVGYLVEGVEHISVDCCGEVLQEKAVLGSILSKASMTAANEIEGLIDSNVYMKPTLMGLLQSLPIQWVVAFFALLLVIIGLSAWEHYSAEKQKVLANLAKKQAALDAAEQARRAESSFLSSMSHDIRTPLNGILGYTHLAKKSESIDEIRHFLDRIDGSGHLMLDIVNDILDLSKIESGKMVLSSEWFDIRELFEAIESSISMNAEGKDIDFSAVCDVPERLYIQSDRLRIQQIAMNLLSNAIKYTPASGHVRWEMSVKKEGEQWMLTEIFKDDGIGMSEEFQEKMFDVFTQENRTEMKGVQGTGLGLSIVSRFVELLGGTIDVKSRLHAGTTFTVRIPVQAEYHETEEVQEDSEGNVSKDFLKGLPILLCEDNEVNAELARFLLSDYGADTIDWAKNGAEGVEMFKNSEENKYKLVLMDLRMPEMNGFDAAENIRALNREDASKAVIIAMSADAYESDVKHCIEVGMNAHISKPINPSELIKVIAKFL